MDKREKKERMERIENANLVLGLESYVCLVGDNHMDQVKLHFQNEIGNGLEVITCDKCGFFNDPDRDTWREKAYVPLLSRLTRKPKVSIDNKKISCKCRRGIQGTF